MAGPGAWGRLHLLLLSVSSWSLISAQVMDKQTIQVPENKPIDLPCTAYVSQSGTPRVEWKFEKGSSIVLFYYDSKFTDPYKDRAKYSPTGISFSSVTRKDTGKYTCEVFWAGSGGSDQLRKSEVDLIVQVPPSKPVAKVPTSVTIGNKAVLTCTETDGSPPPTFQWYRDNILMPSNPKISEKFRNSSYTIDPKTGVLTIEPVTSFDTGDYFCEAQNNVGTAQKSEAIHLEATEVNVGGIVAAVVVLLIVLALVAFGIWFAYSRGFFSKRRGTNKQVIYSQPSNRSDGEFKQTSSFLV
ncbi:junctional adhesion molecule A-like isoform X2 [Trachemys scripta elegans]|uniref:junctional adhesion molecule A-like isoform X2 n=1 Tax=Trachemys scripta elegans TaxID=31138 RepID=UPI00155209FB|nr:junctional adhesion molecule A-like isoform X2 [Trachemys scripta elegans]